MKAETNLSDPYRSSTIQILTGLSKSIRNKSYISMTREDVLFYLDSFRKSDPIDPLHKWIGTYNLRRTVLLRFFKWLYYPSEEPKMRKSPGNI